MRFLKSVSASLFFLIAISTAADPPFQQIPTAPKQPGTFSNGKPGLYAEPPQVSADGQPAEYGARDIDIPFYRLYNGSMNFFSETNVPGKDTTEMGSQYDNANQSACGIPYNAWFISTVAIHPYFLQYAGLDRKFSTIRAAPIVEASLTEDRILYAGRLYLILEVRWQVRHE